MKDLLEVARVAFLILGYRVVVRNRRDHSKSIEKKDACWVALVRGSISAPGQNDRPTPSREQN